MHDRQNANDAQNLNVIVTRRQRWNDERKVDDQNSNRCQKKHHCQILLQRLNEPWHLSREKKPANKNLGPHFYCFITTRSEDMIANSFQWVDPKFMSVYRIDQRISFMMPNLTYNNNNNNSRIINFLKNKRYFDNAFAIGTE